MFSYPQTGAYRNFLMTVLLGFQGAARCWFCVCLEDSNSDKTWFLPFADVGPCPWQMGVL